MLKAEPLAIDEIYVPTKFKGTLEPEKVDSLAESFIEEGRHAPIQVREGNGRYVLVSGYHRLEALKALGEKTIDALVVQSRKY